MKTVDFLQSIAPTSKRFEKNVLALLPENVSKVWIPHVGMLRANGYGSYNYVLYLRVDNCDMQLSVHTNDSQAWDALADIKYGSRQKENWNKRVALAVLEENKDYIIGLLNEEE